MYLDLDQARYGIDLGDCADTVLGLDRGIHRRHKLYFRLVCLVLVTQTAHKSTAGAGDLCRVKGQVLLLCHLDGYLNEIRQEGVTAEGTSANAKTSDSLCLVADTDLAQLDPGAEYRRQILYKLAEVNASVAGKIEQKFGAVESVFYVDQLHLKLVICDLLYADGKGLVFLFGVFCVLLIILFCCRADNGAQRRYDLTLVHLCVAHHNVAVFKASCGLDHCVITVFENYLAGCKVIDLARTAESDTHNVNGVLRGFLFVGDRLGKLRRFNIVLRRLGIIIRADGERVIGVSDLTFNGSRIIFFQQLRLFFAVLSIGTLVGAMTISSVAIVSVVSAVLTTLAALIFLTQLLIFGGISLVSGSFLFRLGYARHKGKSIVCRACLY